MFVRFLQLKVSADHAWLLRKFYEQAVAPELAKFPGCLYAGLIRSVGKGNEFVSLTFWETQAQADAYGRSDVHKDLHKRSETFLSETTEWKIQLSDELQLEYVSATEEPVVESYAVTARSSDKETVYPQASRRSVRIVSASIQEGKLDEFRRLYTEEILPVLRTTDGCRYAFLMENVQKRNEILSITVWDDKMYAEKHEQSGSFMELTRKIRHTLPHFFRWKLALEKRPGQTVKTSEDLTIEHYNVVIGKTFE